MIPITRSIKVVDEFGYPVSGAHIYFSPNNGTSTNSNGTAALTGDPFSTINISFIGKTTEQYTFQNVPKTVVLLEEFYSLDEVVITAPKIKKETPNYVFPALGAAALLLVLMSLGSGPSPKEITF